MPDLTTREGRLEAITADLTKARAEWEALGSPMTTRGANLEVKAHPYIKIIRDLEMMCERLVRDPSAAFGGRPVGSQSAPDRVEGAGTEPPRLAAVA